MSAVYENLRTCLESIQKKVDFKPEVALILGSGLGDYADEIDVVQTLDYTEIEGFPTWICRENSCCNYAGTCALL